MRSDMRQLLLACRRTLALLAPVIFALLMGFACMSCGSVQKPGPSASVPDQTLYWSRVPIESSETWSVDNRSTYISPKGVTHTIIWGGTTLVEGEEFSPGKPGNHETAAKLTLPDGPVRDFTSVRALLSAIPGDFEMSHRMPPLEIGDFRTRQPEEEFVVRVTAWLYAANRVEGENDFHFIIGDAPRNGETPRLMVAEVSGLPKNAFRAQFDAVRDNLRKFFGQDVPRAEFCKFEPPIKIRLTGGLFNDDGRKAVGPPGLESGTRWEIHPVSELIFEP